MAVAIADADQVGVFSPKREVTRDGSLRRRGKSDYLVAGIKEIDGAPVGDTVTVSAQNGAESPLPGFQQSKPNVFAGLYPIDSREITKQFREAIGEIATQ